MTVIVVDDEKKSRETLHCFISTYCPDLEIIGEAVNVSEGIKLINEVNPNVVFLDIEMPDGTGFELLSSFHKINFQVVFVTAFDSYAVRAFRFSAADYLIKPISPKLLIEAVEKLKKTRAMEAINLKLDALLGNHKNIENLALPTAEGVYLARIDQIIHCSADNYYTTFHLVGKEPIVVSKTLKEYSDMLEEFNFYRVHQSHLVNLDHVDKYISGEGGYLIMKNGDTIDVSRRRKKPLLERMLAS